MEMSESGNLLPTNIIKPTLQWFLELHKGLYYKLLVVEGMVLENP
jgi:hypothetical protein